MRIAYFLCGTAQRPDRRFAQRQSSAPLSFLSHERGADDSGDVHRLDGADSDPPQFLEGVDRHLDALVAEKVGASLPMPEMAPALRFRAMNDGANWLPAFQAFCDRYRLDYVIEATDFALSGTPDFRVRVNATGAEIIKFSLGDLIDCYPDGRLVLAEEGSEA